ncbi:hypothetical protein [Candidatus Mycoplasma haematobovis]|nr:hypothetical protein [Candidatus Mycoplasma haematobovis]
MLLQATPSSLASFIQLDTLSFWLAINLDQSPKVPNNPLVPSKTLFA